MKLTEALHMLHEQDLRGNYVYQRQDLAYIFEEVGITLSKTLERLVGRGILERAARSVYVFSLSRHIGGYTIEDIAMALRRYDYNYLSYESALSQYGAISQVPLEVITVATTGREGRVDTPFGSVDFTHTSLCPETIIAQIIERPPHPLPIATPTLALCNQRRTGRNLDLIDKEWQEDVA
jgi:hypothetical protein